VTERALLAGRSASAFEKLITRAGLVASKERLARQEPGHLAQGGQSFRSGPRFATPSAGLGRDRSRFDSYRNDH